MGLTSDSSTAVRGVLSLLHDVEERLRHSPNSRLSKLDVAFVPVGSVVEGTRVGVTNEADFMVDFRKLEAAGGLKLDLDTLEMSAKYSKDYREFSTKSRGFWSAINPERLYRVFIESVHAALVEVTSPTDSSGKARSYSPQGAAPSFGMTLDFSVCTKEECREQSTTQIIRKSVLYIC